LGSEIFERGGKGSPVVLLLLLLAVGFQVWSSGLWYALGTEFNAMNAKSRQKQSKPINALSSRFNEFYPTSCGFSSLPKATHKTRKPVEQACLAACSEAPASQRASAFCYRCTEDVGVLPVVVVALELGDVGRQILGGNLVERADNTALKDEKVTKTLLVLGVARGECR